MQVKARFPLILNISYTQMLTVTQCVCFILTFRIPTVFVCVLNKGMQAKAVETNHRKEEGHFGYQRSTGR